MLTLTIDPNDIAAIDNAVEILHSLPAWRKLGETVVQNLDDRPLDEPQQEIKEPAVMGAGPGPAPMPTEPPPGVIPSLDAVVSDMTAYLSRKPDGMPNLVALLSEFGVAKASEISTEQRLAFLNKVRAL